MERIAIIGAGGMGIVTAYHLRRANLTVDFLVRPNRAAAMPARYRLYSYDDATTQVLDGFGVLARPSELANAEYAYVILTIDGADLSSDEGRALLAEIGAAIRELDTTLVVGSIGIGLRELAIGASSLPEDRVLNGRLALLAHVVAGVSLPRHEPTDPVQLSSAELAFRHVSDGGFALEDRNEAARRFAALFDRCGIARCLLVPPDEFALQSRAIFPVFATCDLLGWPTAGVLAASELWPRTIEAMRQIQVLAEHGAAGRRAAAQTTGETVLAMWTQMERAALPLDWQAFNAYQHGGRVKAADKLLLARCIERGESEGKPMDAVRDLLDRWNAAG